MIWSFFIKAALALPAQPEFVATCDKQITPLLSWSSEEGVQWLPAEPNPDVAKANQDAANRRGGWVRMGDSARRMGDLWMSPLLHPSFHPFRVSSFAHTWTAFSKRSCRPDEVWITKANLLEHPEVREAFEAWQAGSMPGKTWIAEDIPLYSASDGGEAVAFLLRGERVQVTRSAAGRMKVAANLRGQLVQGWAPSGVIANEEPPALSESMGESEQGETWIAACEYDRATLVARWSSEGGLDPVGGEAWTEERLGTLGQELVRRRWTFHSALDGRSEPSTFAAPGVVKVDQISMLDLGRCLESGIVSTASSFAAKPLSSEPSIVVDLTEKQDFYLPHPTRQQCGSVAVQGKDALHMLSELGCEPSWTQLKGPHRGLVSFIERKDGTTWNAVIAEVDGGKVKSSIRVAVRRTPGH